MSFHNLTSSSPRYNEPEDTIKTYTNTKPNEYNPFFSVKNKKISVKPVGSGNVVKQAMEQYFLVSCVVKGLYDQTSLISFSALDLSDQTIISSSSSDSIKPSSTKKFSTHIDQLELYFSNMDSNIKGKKIESKAKVILAIAKEIISLCVDKNVTRERFCRNALANALSCHADLYIKPLALKVDYKIKRRPSDATTYLRNNSETAQKNDLIKNLNTKTFEAFLSYWINPETNVKVLKSPPKTLLKNMLEEDRKIVNKYLLFDSINMSEVLQEFSVRKLITPGSIGPDIGRHMPYVQIKGKNTGQEYIYNQPSKAHTEDPKKFFEEELINFKRMVNVFLTELSKQNPDLIMKIIDLNIANVAKNEAGLHALISSFLNLLYETINLPTLELNELARNLYDLLLTLAQTPYLLPAQPIIAKILKNYMLKLEEGRFFSYEFENNIVKLCITVNMFPSELEPYPSNLKQSSYDLKPYPSNLKQSGSDLKSYYSNINHSNLELKPYSSGVQSSCSELKPSFSEVKLSFSEPIQSFPEIKLPSPEKSKFKIELKNTLTCSTKDTTLWSSEISLHVSSLNPNAKDEIENHVIAPLNNYGFKVTSSLL